jgi:carbonic anhydrase
VSQTEDHARQPAPEALLERLVEGNRRFADGTPEHPRQSITRREALADGQEPFALVLGCADSRVPAEILFDCGLGDLFVVRNAGHVFGSTAQASVEFGVAVLGIRLVLVLGHESCGAVGAAVDTVRTGTPLPGRLPQLVENIAPALDPADPAKDAVARHVRGTVRSLTFRSDVIRDAHDSGDLLLAGGVYDLATGLVRTVTDEPAAA